MRKKRRLDNANEEEGRLVHAQEAAEAEEVEYFPELVERIEILFLYLVRAVASGRADLVVKIINDYEEYVIDIYKEHKFYDSTPTIENHYPILGAVAHEIGFHEICGILGNEECQVMGAEIDAAAE